MQEANGASSPDSGIVLLFGVKGGVTVRALLMS